MLSPPRSTGQAPAEDAEYNAPALTKSYSRF